MVGSLGDEAAQVASALPVGRGYVCEDADDIPRTFAHIFRRARTVGILWLCLLWLYLLWLYSTSSGTRGLSKTRAFDE
jgi:hypothetical protein